MSKIEINLDSTSLGTSACILEFVRTVIGEPEHPERGAYRQKCMDAPLHYGIAGHMFLDTMYKTRGRYDLAQKIAMKWFMDTPHNPKDKAPHLSDPNHLIQTCYYLWTVFIETDGAFEVLSLPGKCWWCKGEGTIKQEELDGVSEQTCTHCLGSKIDTQQAATEVTFSIPFYEDDRLLVNLCGTQDRIGKFKNGVYAIRDWKFSSAWDKKNYFRQYELSRQLRMYTLACKLMAEKYPDSVMGQVGKTHMGACIDAVFLNEKVSETKHEMSPVHQYEDVKIEEFKRQILDFCERLSRHIGQSYYPQEGIINGTCSKLFSKVCQFWVPCKLSNQVSDVILARDFKRQVWDPLHFND